MAQSGNFLLLHRNRVDDGTVTASSAVSAEEAASFIQTLDPSDAWRATGKTSEYVQIDHGKPVTATHAAAVWHNLDTAGTICVQRSNDPTFNPANHIYNSGDQEAWEPVSGFGWDNFGESLGGYPVLDEYNDYRPLKIIAFGAPNTARYSRMIFKNPTNTLITGVACGRAFVGPGDQPLRNFGWDWVMDIDDPSDVVETESAARVKLRPKKQLLEIRPGFLKEQEALSWWRDFKRTIGSSRSVILQMFPTASAPKRYSTQLYGIPVDRQGTRNPFLDVFASSLRVRELRALQA